MDTWTQQKGFPLVMISREGNTITVSQKRFRIVTSENVTDTESKWYIPLSCYTDKEPDVILSIWMNMTDGKIV